MNARLKAHLLRRLRHDARLRAIESALELGLLANAGPERSGSAKDNKPPKPLRRRKFVEEDDGFYFNAVADDDAADIPQRLSLGARLRGRTRLEAARILRRLGLSLPVDDGGRGQTVTVANVLEAIRRGAVPHADEVGVMLLLADAVARSGGSEDAWRGVLRRRDWRATFLSPVDGFQLRLTRMLKEGAFGGPIGIFNGYALSADLTELPSRYERGRTLIVFRGDEDEKYGSIERDERAAFAARLAVPVLGIASSVEHLPARLCRSADLALETGPLTLAIIGDVLREVLGEGPSELATCLSGHLTEAQAASLSIHDLAAAVRPGLAAQAVVATLQLLAGAEGGTGRTGAGGRTGGADRSGAWRGGSSFDSKGRGGRTISSGSEIIEPEVLQDAAAGQSEPMSTGVQDVVHAAPPLSVETLHGYGEARTWALDLKQDLALWQQGTLPWSQLSTRLLLSGPPGTGKTTFARALCNSLQLPLVVTSVSTWLEPGYLGDVIKRMRIAFDEALAHAPAILFIDEIDGIGSRNRGGDYDDYWTGLINKLLELMDGSVKTEGLVIVGATNHPNVIDPAIRRSGRLETHVEIPLPDVDALVGILAHHLGNDFLSVVASKPEPPGEGPDNTSQAHAMPPPSRPENAGAVRASGAPNSSTSTTSPNLPKVERRRC
jgi:cell division protease FtsH